MNREAAAVLRTFDIEIDVSRPLGEFPVAVQHLAAIARAVDLSARVLVLDEPTASLDVHEVAKLFAVMRRLSSRGKIRKSVVEGKRLYVRVDLGGRRIIQKKK